MDTTTPRTIIITGASDGIGKAAATTLAANNEVIIIGRNPDKTRHVASELHVAHHIVDFTNLDDVRRLADKLGELPTIDVLANNAGGVQGSRQLTSDGFERTFQINHLAPFLLTNLLLPKLLASHAHIINTASAANLFGHVRLNNLNREHRYSSWRAYGTTKLENILFTQELARRYGTHGLTSAAFHPGVIASNFGADASLGTRLLYHTPLRKLIGMKDVHQGADTLIWLATTAPPTWTSGGYYADRKPARMNPQAHTPQLAADLWARSAALVGL